jgi:hypothetical protein
MKKFRVAERVEEFRAHGIQVVEFRARKTQRWNRQGRIVQGGAKGISDLGSARDLSDYLKLVKTMRTKWKKKTHTWEGERVTRKGEEEELWFRGQPAEFGLSPRIHRKEYRGAAEEEIRLQYQRRALQLMQARIPDPDRPGTGTFSCSTTERRPGY